ncbi:MAG TPA: DUF4031 domain-containing protein [Pseudoxanthomonas sp.]|nr:DUF4031 domain-containing protein [Pseudoxanthomonas sp.]
MSVYVDDAVTLWRGRRWAQLMADTLEELHAMAVRLGIPPRAFQDSAGAGAVTVSRHADRERMRAVIRMARAQATPRG